MADQAGISEDRAKAMMKDFLDLYPGVQRFLHLLKQRSKKIGYVETLLGRRAGQRRLEAEGGDRATRRQHAVPRVGRRLDRGKCHHTMKLLMMLTDDT